MWRRRLTAAPILQFAKIGFMFVQRFHTHLSPYRILKSYPNPILILSQSLKYIEVSRVWVSG